MQEIFLNGYLKAEQSEEEKKFRVFLNGLTILLDAEFLELENSQSSQLLVDLLGRMLSVNRKLLVICSWLRVN